MAQRIKGQEVEVRIALNGVDQETLTDIRNFEVTPKFEKLEEQYLGNQTKRYDEIFHGVDFKMDMHFSTEQMFNFISDVVARAQRRTPGTTVNIRAKLNFANGVTRLIHLTDCFFDDMPINFGGRSEYGQFTVSGSCTDFTVARS